MPLFQFSNTHAVACFIIGTATPMLCTVYWTPATSSLPWDLLHSMTPEPEDLQLAQVAHYLTFIVCAINIQLNGWDFKRTWLQAANVLAPGFLIRSTLLLSTVWPDANALCAGRTDGICATKNDMYLSGHMLAMASCSTSPLTWSLTIGVGVLLAMARVHYTADIVAAFWCGWLLNRAMGVKEEAKAVEPKGAVAEAHATSPDAHPGG